MPNQHIIEKQTIELRVARSADAFAVQQAMARQVWAAVAPALERLFDRLAPAGELVSLDRLQIDLGNLTEREVADGRFVARLAQLVENQVVEAIRSADKSGEKARQPLRFGLYDRWLFFLENGFLPAPSASPEAGWLDEILKTLASDGWATERLRAAAGRSPDVLKRLVRQHDPVFLKKLAAAIGGKRAAAGEKVWREIELFLKTPAVSAAFLGQKGAVEEAFWVAFFEKILARPDPAAGGWGFLIQKNELLARLSAVFEKLPEAERAAFPELSVLVKSQVPAAEKTGIEMLENDFAQPKTGDAESGGHFLKNAGVVLLHPFLSRFFEKLGLLDGLDKKKFRDGGARSRAIYLLEFIATGDARKPEFSLVLPKMLCGAPLNWPLDGRVLLKKKELREAEKLLAAAIEHWGALGQTSPDGLREGFLKRDGKLEKTDTGWRLRVERKTLDILLDRLPWGIGAVKLPWMEEAVWVDWK